MLEPVTFESYRLHVVDPDHWSFGHQLQHLQDGAPAVLYRLWAGHLLYVGQTTDLRRRMRDHRRTKPWWAKVERIQVERHSTVGDALEAERASAPGRYNAPWRMGVGLAR